MGGNVSDTELARGMDGVSIEVEGEGVEAMPSGDEGRVGAGGGPRAEVVKAELGCGE